MLQILRKDGRCSPNRSAADIRVTRCAGIKLRNPMLMPGVAQPAIQEGEYVADVIRRRVGERAAPKAFRYWDKGDLAIVGRTYAVADLRFARFPGFAAWLLWAGYTYMP